MIKYIEEVDDNFEYFFLETERKVIEAFCLMNDYKDVFKESNRRIVSIQAWNSDLIENIEGNDAKLFFLEAQNDILMSHALARQGAWRVALMSLRSSIENILYGVYYLDHEVELRLWNRGNYRIGFTEALNYIKDHPDFRDVPQNVRKLGSLKKEYQTLSKAVHASSKSFRVVNDGSVEGLNLPCAVELQKWSCRERTTISLLNMIMIIFFRKHIERAGYRNLRKAVSLSVPDQWFDDIKKHLEVTLIKD